MPAGLYCQGTGGKALAMAVEAARHGAEPIAVAAYPVASLLNRVSAEVLCEALTGLELEHGVDVDRVWDASRFIDAHVTSRMPALPVPPRIILRTAITHLPVGLVADIDARLRAADALDRLDEVLAELNKVRADCGTAPLAQPIGGILAGQAVRHVLTARRWAEVSDEMRDLLSGAYGTPPLPFAPEAAAPRRAAAARARARHGRPALAGRRGRQRGGPAAAGALRRGRGPPARGPARARRRRGLGATRSTTPSPSACAS